MNRKITRIASLLLLPWALSLYTPVGMAQPPQRGGPNHAQGDFQLKRAQFEERHEQIMSQLGLTAEQQSQLKALREQGKNEAKERYQQLRVKRHNLMTYLKSPKATEERALQLQNEVNALQNQMSAQRIHTWFQMRKILTPEQLQKLERLKPQRPAPAPAQR
jgi:Spy/CpxP family protein refolding chaperone